jgi:arylsulfatase A-like enzyme
MDRELERFSAVLARRGLDGDAVWVITADHGEGLGNHGFFGHGQYIYNEQIHVPLVVWAPGRGFPPAKVDRLVRQVDLGPTLAAFVGDGLEGQILPPEGRSLLPLLEDPEAPWEEVAAFSQRRPVDERRLRLGWPPGEIFSLTTPGHKIIVHTEGRHEYYDLAADPFELTNRIDEPSGTKDRLLREAVARFRRLFEQGETVGPGQIDPEHVEELKTLGYL